MSGGRMQLTDAMIEELEDEGEAVDLMEELGIDIEGVATLNDCRKRMREHLTQQVKKTFKCKSCELREDDIENLTTVRQARLVLIDHRIPSERVESLDQACELLRTHLEQKKALEPYDIAEVANVVRKLVEDTTQGRRELLSQLREIEQYMGEIPKERRKEVEKQVGNIEEELKSIETQLGDDNCTLMVAGETGAGKSCLLNLLLGEIVSQLLEVNNLPSTSALCEIKYGDRKLKAYPSIAEDSSVPATEVDLDVDTAPATIAKYASERGNREELAYKKVEIYWPVDWIKYGVTITDTPGIGESEELTQIVKDYIPQAAGFIYVINTPNAGGINPQELEELLFYHIGREGIPDDPDLPVAKAQQKIKFDPRSAIFVCNKWDQVPLSERNEVKEYVKKKLQKIWKDFDFEDQVFFISATQVAKELESGYVNSEYRRLLSGIQKLLPRGFRNKMEKQFWKLFHIIERSTWVIQNYIMCGSATEEEKSRQKTRYQRAKAELMELKKRPEKAKWQMKSLIDQKVKAALSKIRDHMKSEEVMERMINWKESECPDNPNLQRLIELQSSFAAKRLQQEIHRFEEEQGFFEEIQKLLVDKFQSIFFSVEAELLNIEDSMDDSDKVQTLVNSYYTTSTDQKTAHRAKSIRKMGGATNSSSASKKQVWTPLGVLVGAFALPSTVKRNVRRLREAKKIQEYRDNKAAVMGTITKEMMVELVDSRRLRDVIEGKLTLLNKKFTKLLNKIPDIIEANRDMISQLEKELENKGDFLNYKPIHEKGTRLRDRLNLTYMSSIRTYNIDMSRIKNTKRIGEGSFAWVSMGKYHRKGGVEDVAVKKFKVSLTEDNVTDFLMEEINLMRVKSPYVVRYIGTSCRKSGHMLFPAIVQEYCEHNLGDIIYSKHKYNGPGTVADADESRSGLQRQVASFAFQISLGLEAMHSQGLVHRDLKPENILVDKSGEETVLKLCDLGISKREADITKTYAGTPIYMAPEIRNEQTYDRSVDVFSFGLIVWELWYGQEIENAYTIENYQQFLKRPFKPFHPPESWKDIMTRCWSEDKQKRPTAKQCSQVFSPQN